MSEFLAAIREQVRRTPDRVALVGGRETLTYQQLWQTSAGLAGRLAEVGAGPGRTVGLYLPQGLSVIVGVFASLRVGSAWAVVEPGRPVVRLKSLLENTDCAAVVHAGQKPPFGEKLVDYQESGQAADVVVDGGAAAYLVFTSGTTGQPKAAMISRANLDAAIAGLKTTYGERTVALSAMSVSFDALLGSLFVTLSTGGTFVLPDARELLDPIAMADLAAEHRITRFEAVPSFYQLLLDRANGLPDSIETVLLGGEVLTPALVGHHRAVLPNARLLNAYGPTETTIACTLHEVRENPGITVPIGPGLPGTTVHVMDDQLQPVPPGQIGELYVGGDYVGLGYAGDPRQTAHRFVAAPDGTRMYRTGDLAAVGPAGALTFHGRVDDQVKIRGVRIELGEIEHVLQTHNEVRQAAVIRDGEGVVAFVAGTASNADLRAHCAKHLIEQAIPGIFVSVERIPLTQNGKADRNALRSFIPATPDAVPAVLGWTKQQCEVAAEWAAVLRHHDAGLRDRFWQVGGTSLKLMDLYERLDTRWPGRLRVGELFELDTIEAQAAAIESRASGPDRSAQRTAPMFRLEV
jgi:amino acid adenylation domain-containing protein